MINIEKVKSMTKAAAYEKGPEKKNIGISSYFRADYLGLQMVKSAVAYTLAFAILAALWSLGKMETVMLMLSRPESVKNMIKILVILFLAGLALYETAIYVYYSEKYQSAKKSVGSFYVHLKHIHKFYEEQESAGESGRSKDQADVENRL